MKKWIFVVPLITMMSVGSWAISLSDQMAALEQAGMAEVEAHQRNLPTKFADEQKQATFDANLKKAISKMEKEVQSMIDQYMEVLEAQISKKDKKALNEAKDQIVAAQEIGIISSLVYTVMAGMMGEELRFPTEEEQNSAVYALYHSLKSSSQDYSRYLRHMEAPAENSVSDANVMQAMEAFYKVVEDIANAE